LEASSSYWSTRLSTAANALFLVGNVFTAKTILPLK